MNSLPLILFFASFLGIALLIGRKVFALRGAGIENIGEIPFEVPDLQEIKIISSKKARRLGYVVLVISIRGYIRTSILLKKVGKNIYESAKNRLERNRFTKNPEEQREVSKFLKGISEYKEKIKRIKHRIIEEENMR